MMLAIVGCIIAGGLLLAVSLCRAAARGDRLHEALLVELQARRGRCG